VKRRRPALLLLCVVSQLAAAQPEAVLQPEPPNSVRGASRWPFAGLVTVLFPILLPKILADVTRLREYIQTDDFAAIRRAAGDTRAVDALYDRARELSWGNTYEALLVSTFATMEHRRIGVRLPIVGPLVWIPLTSEFEDDFRSRIRSLPSRMYADTPPGIAGDRDKLQHFFGSAFLTCFLESQAGADRIGEFVEWGEERFIVDGVNDDRDRRANWQGQQFGLTLMEDPDARPSVFLRSEVVDLQPGPVRTCGRGDIPRGTITHLEAP
jgi:hypothetical protein